MNCRQCQIFLKKSALYQHRNLRHKIQAPILIIHSRKFSFLPSPEQSARIEKEKNLFKRRVFMKQLYYLLLFCLTTGQSLIAKTTNFEFLNRLDTPVDVALGTRKSPPTMQSPTKRVGA